MKKQTIITACTFAAMTMATPAVFAVQPAMSNHVCASDAIKKDNRPVESKRLFRSKAVEEQIQRIQSMDETAQNAPVGIGVMNGKSRPCKAGRLQLVPVHIK